MRWWMVTAYGLSVVAHFGLAAGIGSIPKNRPRKVQVVKVFDAKPAKKKAAEEDKKPPKVENKPKPPPPPKNTPPPAPTNAAPPPPQAPMAALPDFGLSLSGGGEGGIAIPVAGMMAAAGTSNRGAGPAGGSAPGEKRVKAAAPKPTEASDGCVEETIKPKAVSRSQPQYVDEARAANVEGVVKFEVSIGADGEVLDVKILQGLGHGLDQSVLATVKTWKFNPATRCGKPAPSRYVSQIRFGLTGD